MKKRAEEEAARVRLIQAEREAKNKALDRVMEKNEETSVLLSVRAQLHSQLPSACCGGVLANARSLAC